MFFHFSDRIVRSVQWRNLSGAELVECISCSVNHRKQEKSVQFQSRAECLRKRRTRTATRRRSRRWRRTRRTRRPKWSACWPFARTSSASHWPRSCSPFTTSSSGSRSPRTRRWRCRAADTRGNTEPFHFHRRPNTPISTFHPFSIFVQRLLVPSRLHSPPPPPPVSSPITSNAYTQHFRRLTNRISALLLLNGSRTQCHRATRGYISDWSGAGKSMCDSN